MESWALWYVSNHSKQWLGKSQDSPASSRPFDCSSSASQPFYSDFPGSDSGKSSESSKKFFLKPAVRSGSWILSFYMLAF